MTTETAANHERVTQALLPMCQCFGFGDMPRLTAQEFASVAISAMPTPSSSTMELYRAIKAVRAFMIPGMNWTDEIGRALVADLDEAIAKIEAGLTA